MDGAVYERTAHPAVRDTGACSRETQKGLARAQQAQEKWQQQWHSVAALADHAPMDEIDGLFAQMETYSKAGAAVDAAACCARLSKLVAAVGEAHSLNWWNLL